MRKLLLLALLVTAALGSTAQTGKVFDSLTLKSKILNMERKFAIYLPPDYELSQRSYPVLYLLHGAGETAGTLRVETELVLRGSSGRLLPRD